MNLKYVEIRIKVDSIIKKEESVMRMSYKDALMAPDISWNQLTATVTITSKLYKYQNFYTDVGKKNPFLEKNMNDEFHLSLGCEFEDINRL